MNGDCFAAIVYTIIVLWTAYRLGAWAIEYIVMTRKGYWYDDGFQGRGEYCPRWRHETKPTLPAKYSIN